MTGKTTYCSAGRADAQADSRWGDALLAIWTAAGLPVPERWRGPKTEVKCPLHEDHNASAVLMRDRGVFHCSVCGSFSTKKLAAALDVAWPPHPGVFGARPVRIAPKTKNHDPPEFTPADAQLTWAIALRRARDDNAVDADRRVYNYIHGRGVADGWEDSLFGIMPPHEDDRLPAAVRWWGPGGWRVVLPIYAVDGDNAGKIVAVQSRHIGSPPLSNRKRLLFPEGSHVRRAAFTNKRARAMLGGAVEGKRVIVVEGMFDYLTAALGHDDMPVLGAPGAGQAKNVIAAWARDHDVVLAIHKDSAGEQHTPTAIAKVRRMGGRPLVAHIQRREAQDD